MLKYPLLLKWLSLWVLSHHNNAVLFDLYSICTAALTTCFQTLFVVVVLQQCGNLATVRTQQTEHHFSIMCTAHSHDLLTGFWFWSCSFLSSFALKTLSGSCTSFGFFCFVLFVWSHVFYNPTLEGSSDPLTRDWYTMNYHCRSGFIRG